MQAKAGNGTEVLAAGAVAAVVAPVAGEAVALVAAVVALVAKPAVGAVVIAVRGAEVASGWDPAATVNAPNAARRYRTPEEYRVSTRCVPIVGRR